MGLLISKKDAKIMVEQSKQMIEIGEKQKELANDAIRKANIDITSAKAILKFLRWK